MTIPTPHLAAREGDIADAVLLPGDPLRAEQIATKLLTDAVCYNSVRGMLGFTGTYQGRRVSVQGTGMGMPSIAIYATELMRFHGVRTAIRVGSCGALVEHVKLRDVIIALSAHTNSSMAQRYFKGIQYAPTANFELVAAAVAIAREQGLNSHVGPIYTSDVFYDESLTETSLLAAHGTLAVEMECAALYTIAAREKARALTLVTVSDHLITHEASSIDERQNGFMAMAQLALDTIIAS